MRIFFFFTGLVFVGGSLCAQYYYENSRYYSNDVVLEVGGSAGLMNCLTDLGGKKGKGKNFIKDLRWKTAKPCFSVYAMAMYRDAIGLRLEASFGSVAGYDSILKDVAASTFGRYERNLSFKSPVNDFQLALEVHPLLFKFYDEREPPRFSPYAVAGVGYYTFNPQGKLNGQWYALQPLRTEGQGFNEYPDRQPYQLRQFNIAAGGGFRYEASSFIYLRLEVVQRILFTDYLDDASTNFISDPALFDVYLPAGQAALAKQLYNRRAELIPGQPSKPGDERGDPKDNDTFFTIQLKAGFMLGRQKR